MKDFKVNFMKGSDFDYLSPCFVGHMQNEKLVELHNTMKPL